MGLSHRILLGGLAAFAIFGCQTAKVNDESDTEVKDVQTIEAGEFVYIIQPLRDYLAGLAGGVREQGEAELVSESIALVKEWGKRNQDRLPPHLRVLDNEEFTDTDSVAKNLVTLRKQMSEAVADGAADIGVQVSDFIPSGFVLYGGGSFSTTAIGGSSLFGIVIVPLKIIRVSKAKPTENSGPARVDSLGFSVSIVNISEGDVGISSPNGRAQAGIGIIFKRLNRATDFVGLTTGLNLNVKFPTIGKLDAALKSRLGANFQVMCRVGGPDDLCLNVGLFAGIELGKFTSGPRPLKYAFSLAGKTGAIIPLSKELGTKIKGGALEESVN